MNTKQSKLENKLVYNNITFLKWMVGKALNGLCANPSTVYWDTDDLAELAIERAKVTIAELERQSE